jgi:hypothetical protein
MIKFKKLLNKYNVSIRYIFSNYVSDGAIILNRDEFLKAFEKIVCHECDHDIMNVKNYASDIFNKYSNNSININLLSFFEAFGKKKNFVFIIPSYNNINNYFINLESVRKQMYSHLHFRIIYISDCSNDGTDDAILKYINDNKLDNCFEFLRMNRRQRQGMVRFTAFHKCFDDEICINLDGDDWLYDIHVLDNLNRHFTTKNIMVSYGSYFCYDHKCINMYDEKTMNVPYNNKLIGVSEFPVKIKKEKLFKYVPWISTHLRSGYAKLFKSIELRHFIDHEGNFFKMVTDGCEMYPVLEMSHMKNANIMKPMLVYNKYNSELYNTSYYKKNDPSNKYYAKYREKVSEIIKSRNIYPDMIDPIKLEKIDPTIKEYNINILREISIPKFVDDLKSDTSDYIFLKDFTDTNNESNISNNRDILDLIKLIYRSKPGAIILSQIKTENHSGASLEIFKTNTEKSYYAIKKFFDLFSILSDNESFDKIKMNKIDLLKLVPGFYNRQKMISIMSEVNDLLNEVILQRMI